MPAPTICTVSGTVRDQSGATLSGVIVRATNLRPYVHPTDSSMIMPFLVSATSAADGTWSLALVETATASKTVVVSLIYSTGTGLPTDSHDYTITVPNSATATFASLISGEI